MSKTGTSPPSGVGGPARPDDLTAYFLGGRSYPSMQHVEVALQERLRDLLPHWIGQADILRRTRAPGIEPAIERRVSALRTILQNEAAAADAVMMGFSSGGRTASTFAHRYGARAVIALGYPFRMPRRVIEPDRWSHLPRVTVPTLILQGVRDAFGGLDITEDYRLSAAVAVRFLDTDHNFDLTPSGWDDVAQEIRAFLGSVLSGAAHPSLPFDEAFYLATYRDVAQAVRDGIFVSGEAHFHRYGSAEGRRFRYLPALAPPPEAPPRGKARGPVPDQTVMVTMPRPVRRRRTS